MQIIFYFILLLSIYNRFKDVWINGLHREWKEIMTCVASINLLDLLIRDYSLLLFRFFDSTDNRLSRNP